MMRNRKANLLVIFAAVGGLLLSPLPAQAATTSESGTSTAAATINALPSTGNLTMAQADSIHDLIASGELTLTVNGAVVPSLNPQSGKANASISSVPSLAALYVPTTWAACNSNWTVDVYKTVRTFVPAAPVAGNIILNCGTAGWGYRHMLGVDQQARWAPLAAMVGANWRDFVDFAMETTVKNPYSVTGPAANGTYNFRGIVQLKKYNGTTVYTSYPDIAYDAVDGRVITVIPKSTP